MSKSLSSLCCTVHCQLSNYQYALLRPLNHRGGAGSHISQNSQWEACHKLWFLLNLNDTLLSDHLPAISCCFPKLFIVHRTHYVRPGRYYNHEEWQVSKRFRTLDHLIQSEIVMFQNQDSSLQGLGCSYSILNFACKLYRVPQKCL